MCLFNWLKLFFFVQLLFLKHVYANNHYHHINTAFQQNATNEFHRTISLVTNTSDMRKNASRKTHQGRKLYYFTLILEGNGSFGMLVRRFLKRPTLRNICNTYSPAKLSRVGELSGCCLGYLQKFLDHQVVFSYRQQNRLG